MAASCNVNLIRERHSAFLCHFLQFENLDCAHLFAQRERERESKNLSLSKIKLFSAWSLLYVHRYRADIEKLRQGDRIGRIFAFKKMDIVSTSETADLVSNPARA
jgi:hypothetical protein